MSLSNKQQRSFIGRDVQLIATALLGVALLAIPGWRYRIDGPGCGQWPALLSALSYGAVFCAGLALLAFAWLRQLHRCQSVKPPSLKQVMGGAVLLHAAALLVPPFLSDDPLFYAATGRILADFGRSAYEPLCQVLPAGDRFLTGMTESWRCGTSAYASGFHLLAWAIGKLAHADLALHLRLYQLTAAVTVVVTAGLAALAVRGSAMSPAAAAAAVAWNPLAVIEGTIGAHNDVLLALACALFVLAVRRGRPLWAGAWLLGALLVKLSAVLMIWMYSLFLVSQRLRRRSPQLAQALPWFLGGLLLLGLVGVVALMRQGVQLAALASLLGQPVVAYDHCTRSLECLPRVVLRFGLQLPTAAWGVGLLFRWLSALWLTWVVCRAAHSLLSSLALGLFGYYLFLHGWAQSWYLLSLLPLLPFASAKLRPAMYTVCISSCAYYAIYLVAGCVVSPLAIGRVDLSEALVTILPPSVALWRYRNYCNAQVV